MYFCCRKVSIVETLLPPPTILYEESNYGFLLASLLYFDCDIQIICVRMQLYPSRLFLQAAISLDTTCFDYMKEFPLFGHGKSGSLQSWKNLNLWMDMGRCSSVNRHPFSQNSWNRISCKACFFGYSALFLKSMCQ